MTQRNTLCENMKTIKGIAEDLAYVDCLNSKGIALAIVGTEDAEHSDVVECRAELKDILQKLGSILGQELQLALKNTYDDWVHVKESDLSYRISQCS